MTHRRSLQPLDEDKIPEFVERFAVKRGRPTGPRIRSIKDDLQVARDQGRLPPVAAAGVYCNSATPDVMRAALHLRRPTRDGSYRHDGYSETRQSWGKVDRFSWLDTGSLGWRSRYECIPARDPEDRLGFIPGTHSGTMYMDDGFPYIILRYNKENDVFGEQLLVPCVVGEEVFREPAVPAQEFVRVVQLVPTDIGKA